MAILPCIEKKLNSCHKKEKILYAALPFCSFNSNTNKGQISTKPSIIASMYIHFTKGQWRHQVCQALFCQVNLSSSLSLRCATMDPKKLWTRITRNVLKYFLIENLEKTMSGGCKQTTLFSLLVFMNLWQCLISNFGFFIWWRENNFAVTILETTWAKMMLDVNISIKLIFSEKSPNYFWR